MLGPRAPNTSSETSCASAAVSSVWGGVQRPRICVPDRDLGLGASVPGDCRAGRPPRAWPGAADGWEATVGRRLSQPQASEAGRTAAPRTERAAWRGLWADAAGRGGLPGQAGASGRPNHSSGGEGRGGGLFRCGFLGPAESVELGSAF